MEYGRKQNSSQKRRKNHTKKIVIIIIIISVSTEMSIEVCQTMHGAKMSRLSIHNALGFSALAIIHFVCMCVFLLPIHIVCMFVYASKFTPEILYYPNIEQ